VTILVGVALAVVSKSLPAETTALLLFGGEDHKTFLGCLNCGRTSPGSVCSRYGEYGSRYSDTSVWSRYGNYGSRYSAFSPWNKFASDPPVIVDREGGFYGYFTANKSHPKRTRNTFYLVFLDNVDEVNEDLQRARHVFCDESE
jgi:hypothetical protein